MHGLIFEVVRDFSQKGKSADVLELGEAMVFDSYRKNLQLPQSTPHVRIGNVGNWIKLVGARCRQKFVGLVRRQ